MFVPVNFILKPVGRIGYLFFGMFFVFLGCVILYALIFSNRSHIWLEYLFALPVISIWLIYGVVCLLKALKSNPRIVITEAGITYHGLFQTSIYLWSNLISVNFLHSRYSDYWLKVIVNTDSAKTKSHKFDFNGLNLDRMEFVNLLRVFAPSATIKF